MNLLPSRIDTYENQQHFPATEKLLKGNHLGVSQLGLTRAVNGLLKIIRGKTEHSLLIYCQYLTKIAIHSPAISEILLTKTIACFTVKHLRSIFTKRISTQTAKKKKRKILFRKTLYAVRKCDGIYSARRTGKSEQLKAKGHRHLV